MRGLNARMMLRFRLGEVHLQSATSIPSTLKWQALPRIAVNSSGLQSFQCLCINFSCFTGYVQCFIRFLWIKAIPMSSSCVCSMIFSYSAATFPFGGEGLHLTVTIPHSLWSTLHCCVFTDISLPL